MRVVDDHAEGLPAFDTLHTPAHGARARERLPRVLQRRARRETGGRRGQRVVDIEPSDERKGQLDRLPGSRDLDPRA